MAKLSLIPHDFLVICENYSCNNIANFSIGNPEAPRSTHFNICEECLEQLRKDTGFNQNKIYVLDEYMTKAELFDIAVSYGLKPTVRNNKAELMEMIKEFSYSTHNQGAISNLVVDSDNNQGEPEPTDNPQENRTESAQKPQDDEIRTESAENPQGAEGE